MKFDSTWSGTVIVDGVVFVPEGVTLKIVPGTKVLFKKSKAALSEDADGNDSATERGSQESASEVLIPGSGIKVEGKIIAEGEKGKEITFTSAESSPAPGDWGCIFLDHSKGSIFKYCRFEYSAYTIHAHFSQLSVSRCVLTHNEDGSRLGQCRASFDHCEIKDNTGKGLNFRQSKVDVSFCEITGNRDGIFLNEKDSACVIEHNNIYGNAMDLRLGDFHKEDIKLAENWWGSADVSEIRKKVYDKSSDPEIGKAEIVLPLSQKVLGAGPDGPELKAKWKFKTGAYVDGGAAEDNGVVYFGSWDHNFYAVRADTGELIWKFQTGDCVDSTPAVSEGKVYFGSWDRNIYCLNAKDGKLIWKFTMPPSNFDDHRQASPAMSYKTPFNQIHPTLFIGGFNGFFYSLDAINGKELWEFKTAGPIRNRAIFKQWAIQGIMLLKYTIAITGSADGILYAFDSTGKELWQFKTGGTIVSTPLVELITFGEGCPDPDCLHGEEPRIYLGSRDGEIYCLGANGNLIWSYSTSSRIEYSSPLIVNNLVFIGDCSGTLHAVDKDTGKAVWKFTGWGVIYSSPVLARTETGIKILYGDNSGGVYCLDPKSGGLLAFFKAGGAVQNVTYGIGSATTYASSRDGFLYALTVSE